MKKLMTIALLFAVSTSFAACDKTEVISVADLPAKSRSFLNSYFADVEVLNAVKEIDDLEKEYSVYLTNGVKITFDRKGEWDSVDGSGGAGRVAVALPDGFIAALPSGIAAYVNEHHPGQFIVKVDKQDRDDPGKYEVELDNKTELLFDAAGGYIGWDD